VVICTPSALKFTLGYLKGNWQSGTSVWDKATSCGKVLRTEVNGRQKNVILEKKTKEKFMRMDGLPLSLGTHWPCLQAVNTGVQHGCVTLTPVFTGAGPRYSKHGR